jgi:MFS family permease
LAGGSRFRSAVASLIVARIIYASNWLNIGAIFRLMEGTLGVGVIGLGTVTSSFLLGIGLVQIPAGVLAAKLGPKKVVVWGIMLSSFATLGIAGSTLLLEVTVLRFLVGAGMAFVFAPAVVLVARFIGGNRFGIGVGLFNSAYNIGGILGLYGWIIIATSTGWQWSLVLAGVLGVVTGLLVAYYVPSESGGLDFKVRFPTLLGILKDRQLILLGLGTLGLDAGNVLISSFMVYYLSQSLGVPLATGGLVTAMIVVVPIATSIWGGNLYDRLRRPKLLMILSCLTMGIAVLLASIPSFAAAVVTCVLGGVAVGVGFTVTFAWARDLNTAEPRYDGLAIAWVNGISLTGSFVPPLVYSFVVGGFGYSAGWIAGAAMCFALTVPLLFQREGIPVKAA